MVCRYGESGAAQLEMPRLALYLSNGIFVLSERGLDPALDDSLEGMLVFIPPDLGRVRVASRVPLATVRSPV